MCGIAGFLDGPQDPESRTTAIQAMIAALRRRGPDERGFQLGRRTTLGHARLTILDLSSAGRQPMRNDDGSVWIAYNGEVYNYLEERRRLEAAGYAFRSTTDTEVLLAAYELDGPDFVRRLRGIFAFAIVDEREGPGRERLLLARDPLGVKPLLYARLRNGGLAFASELKSLLASGLLPRALDRESLRALLAFGSVPQPRTLVEGVSCLPAGHILSFGPEGERLRRFAHFEIDLHRDLSGLPYSQIVDRVDAALSESVAAQMVADVPVGAFLSGGVDSSLIVAMMQTLTSKPVRTFSVGFAGGASEDARLDEANAAEATAQLLGTDHARVDVRGEDLNDSLDDFIEALDQPSMDGVNSYFVSKAVGGDVKVALSGTGGDELFAGYPWFAQMRHASRPTARTRLRDLIRGSAPSGRRSFLEAYANLHRCFGDEGAASLMPRDRIERTMAGYLREADELPNAEALDRISVLCLNSYCRNQLLRDIDACSMHHGLEVRVPLLDQRLVELALSLPADSKLAPGATHDLGDSYDRAGVKRVLVDVARRRLPAEFFATRGKQGFNMPMAAWLKGPLAGRLRDATSSAQLGARGWLDAGAVEDVVTDFSVGRRPWTQAWILLLVELWADRVLYAKSGPAPTPARKMQ